MKNGILLVFLLALASLAGYRAATTCLEESRDFR